MTSFSTSTNLSVSNKSTSNRRSVNSNSHNDINNSDSIKVLVRFRPSRNKLSNVIDAFKLNESASEIEYLSEWQESKLFKYDKVFDTQTTQLDVFNEVSDTVISVMNGFNGTIMAYGQTSAGKSWTMEGSSIFDPVLGGIVPRCVDKLFDEIDKADLESQFQIIVSYYEIYCEKVRDLLNPQQVNMKVRESKNDGFIVQDVTEVYCTDKESVMRVMELGKTNRIAAPTLMNAESSRSHSIFSILVHQHDLKSGRHRKGSLFLVDLAGSEKVSKTGAKGLRLEEAKNINSSLSCLGMVINSLSDGAPHIPYRDSKLTMLLMEALGGNSKTTLIICCNSEKDHISETLSTLRFGERAKRVKNIARINEDLSAEELKIMLDTAKKDINYLKKILQKVAINVKDPKICSNCKNVISNTDTAIVDMISKALGSGNTALSNSNITSENDDTISDSQEDLANSNNSSNKNSFYSNQVQKYLDEIIELTSKITSLEEEIETENNRYQKEYELRVQYSGEVDILKTTIAELEEKILKHNLQMKKSMNTSSSSSSSSSSSVLNNNDLQAIPSEYSIPGVVVAHGDKHALLVSEPSTVGDKSLLEEDVGVSNHHIENELNPQSQVVLHSANTNQFNITDTETNCAINDQINEINMIAEALDNNDIESLNAQSNKEIINFSINDYEKHVRRLEFILDQEQNERLKVEGKLIDVLEELSELQCDSGSKTPPKSAKKSLFNGLFNNSNKKKENSTSFTSQISETFFKRSYNSREAVLAETLELAQQRIVQLVMELDTNNEAQAIVLETKESVLRSLARQNTHLAIERDNLTKKNEELSTKVDQLTLLLRSIQQSRTTVGNNINNSIISGGYKHRKSVTDSSIIKSNNEVSNFIHIGNPDITTTINSAPPIKTFFFNGSGKINRNTTLQIDNNTLSQVNSTQINDDQTSLIS